MRNDSQREALLLELASQIHREIAPLPWVWPLVGLLTVLLTVIFARVM